MTQLSFSQKLRLVIANLSAKERAVFITSIILLGVGIFGGLVHISDRYTKQVPIYGGTYKEGIIGSPRYINPVLGTSDADKDLASLVYSGLVRVGQDGTLEPDLASSWTISPDGTVYTVNLKQGLTFQDGKPLTANDVVFTVQKIQDANLNSPLQVAWNGVTASATDDHTIVFTLQKPYADFLSQLTVGILPQHIWSTIPDTNWQTTQFNTEPIGSGPYKLKHVSRSEIGIPQNYTLIAFKKFALGRPWINRFVVVCLANQTDAYNAFESGSIDGLSMVNSADIASVKNSHTNVIAEPLPRVFGEFFNPIKNSIFSDHQVITALNLALDKASIIQSVFKGYAVALNGPLPQFVDTNTTDYATNQALAEKILDADGWKLNPATGIRQKLIGKQMTSLSFALSTANTPELEESAQLISDEYAQIGVHVEVKIFEIGTLNQDVIRGRDFEALLFGQAESQDTDIYAFWDSSQKADPGLNITSYMNKNVDAWLKQAIAEPDPTKRFALYQLVSNQLAKDAPVAFLYTPDFTYLMNKRVKNVTIPPISESSDRFSLVSTWYLYTDTVWNGFLKK